MIYGGGPSKWFNKQKEEQKKTVKRTGHIVIKCLFGCFYLQSFLDLFLSEKF